jgi:acetyl-CoA acetyltransferase
VPLGHPYGMSGIRYLESTMLELRRRAARRAIVGVCTVVEDAIRFEYRYRAAA